MLRTLYHRETKPLTAYYNFCHFEDFFLSFQACVFEQENE